MLDYRIIIAITKGDVGAVNILQDALSISKELYVSNPLGVGANHTHISSTTITITSSVGHFHRWRQLGKWYSPHCRPTDQPN